MPLYEFECQNCQHRFERIQSFSAPDPDCVKCGGKVERLLHASALQFKGSGWYATDYAKKSKESGAKPEAKSGDKSETSSTPKSESKSETKSESKTESKSGAKSTGSKE
ncbi:MAG: FmdB family zinc ribbon protein [Terriglobales bacterium]